ncbi:MAG: YggS family pyridoxal phosphate-dependent enzyme [Bryobacteraceae bacterium]
MLRERLDSVEDRIARAAVRSGRCPQDITLVAVTKKFPAGAIEEAARLGVRHFGENYVQEFETKRAALASLAGVRFHLIGHLQANKARKAVELFDVIQTVDSARLAERLNQAAAGPIDVMLEVKLSPEASKVGVSPEDVPRLVEAVAGCPSLRLRGLMTMPPWSEEAEPSRPYFRRLRALGEANGLAELSMGMSHDFEAAIEEGATLVRIGTALFGPRRRA